MAILKRMEGKSKIKLILKDEICVDLLGWEGRKEG